VHPDTCAKKKPTIGDKKAKVLLLAAISASTGLWYQNIKLSFSALFNKVILDVSTGHRNTTLEIGVLFNS